MISSSERSKATRKRPLNRFRESGRPDRRTDETAHDGARRVGVAAQLNYFFDGLPEVARTS